MRRRRDRYPRTGGGAIRRARASEPACVGREDLRHSCVERTRGTLNRFECAVTPSSGFPEGRGRGFGRGYDARIADRLSLSAGTLRVVDVAVVLWTIAWVSLAFAVASEVRGLRQLSVTVVAAGVAAEETGRAVAALDDLPLVGDDVGRLGDRAREAGERAQESGAASRESVESLSVLLGLTIGLVPTLPLLAVWVPLRIRRARDVRALSAAVASHGDDPAFCGFLARRAVERLPYARLLSLAPEPWRDASPEEERRLARAELERLGLEPRRR